MRLQAKYNFFRYLAEKVRRDLGCWLEEMVGIVVGLRMRESCTCFKAGEKKLADGERLKIRESKDD